MAMDGEVHGDRGAERAVDAADEEHAQVPMAKSNGVRNISWPRHIVKIQLNIFTPVGTAMRNVMRLKNGR